MSATSEYSARSSKHVRLAGYSKLSSSRGGQDVALVIPKSRVVKPVGQAMQRAWSASGWKEPLGRDKHVVDAKAEAYEPGAQESS